MYEPFYNLNCHTTAFVLSDVASSDMVSLHSLVLFRCCWQKSEAAIICLQWKSLKRTSSSRTRTRRVLWWRGGFWRSPHVPTSLHRSIAPSRPRCVCMKHISFIKLSINRLDIWALRSCSIAGWLLLLLINDKIMLFSLVKSLFLKHWF